MDIRLANDTDLQSVTACIQAAFSVWVDIIGARPIALDTDYAPLIAQHKVYIATEDGQTLGVMALWPINGALYIDTLAVNPTLQNRGIGGQFLTFADSHARTLGETTLRLCTNEKMRSNRSYYQKWGYQEVRQEPHHDGRIVVWLEKPLNPPA